LFKDEVSGEEMEFAGEDGYDCFFTFVLPFNLHFLMT